MKNKINQIKKQINSKSEKPVGFDIFLRFSILTFSYKIQLKKKNKKKILTKISVFKINRNYTILIKSVIKPAHSPLNFVFLTKNKKN